MPNRMLRDSCRTSETLDHLSWPAEVLFYRLILSADDYGRFEADPEVALSIAWPRRARLYSAEEFEDWLCELEEWGLVGFYSKGGRSYGVFNEDTWDRCQHLKAPRSKYPPPPASILARILEKAGNGSATRAGAQEAGDGDGDGKGSCPADWHDDPGDETFCSQCGEAAEADLFGAVEDGSLAGVVPPGARPDRNGNWRTPSDARKLLEALRAMWWDMGKAMVDAKKDSPPGWAAGDRGLTKSRVEAARKLVSRPLEGTSESWKSAIDRIPECPFLIGEVPTDHSPNGFRADVDWLLKPDSATKILEGKYDRGRGKKGKSHTDYREAAAKGLYDRGKRKT